MKKNTEDFNLEKAIDRMKKYAENNSVRISKKVDPEKYKEVESGMLAGKFKSRK